MLFRSRCVSRRGGSNMRVFPVKRLRGIGGAATGAKDALCQKCSKLLISLTGGKRGRFIYPF